MAFIENDAEKSIPCSFQVEADSKFLSSKIRSRLWIVPMADVDKRFS
jgi:hypothetical protein